MRSWLIAALVVVATTGCAGSSTSTDTPATTTTSTRATTTRPFRCPDGSKPVPLPPPTDARFAYECSSVTADGPPVSYKP